MSKQQIIQPLETLKQNIVEMDYDTFFKEPGGPYQPWNNLDINDYQESVEKLNETLEQLFSTNILEEQPWNILHGMQGAMNNVFQHNQQLFQQKNDQAFQKALQQVEALRTNLQTWGINYLLQVGKDLEDKSRLIDAEIQKLLQNNKEIETIKENVNKLIEPAVAGSLSKSFSDRKNDLNTIQGRWFWASASAAIVAVSATIWVVASIVGFFQNTEVLEVLKNQEQSNQLIWSTVALRIGALLPIFSIFGLAFSQYRKERNLEEEYAHKSAVASSLPNYADLAVVDDVKDQILSEASSVIFVSPTSQSTGKSGKEVSVPIKDINELLGSIKKLIPGTGKSES
ncbi:MAG: hypothetical protein AB2809_13930 [Candidatus Thiodiazotropha sp.]